MKTACECHICILMPKGRYCRFCGWCKGLPDGIKIPTNKDCERYGFTEFEES